MKVKVIASKPKAPNEIHISHLIGQEFEVNSTYENGAVSIEYGKTGGYYLHKDEFEVVEA